MGYAVPNRNIEMGSRSGPCIVVRPADKKSSDKKQELIDALRAGEKEKFMKENGLSEKNIQGMHNTMTYFPRQTNNMKALLSGRKLEEFLRYSVELYFEGMSVYEAIEKAKKTIYGKV